jgi:hypothetical protein
MSAQLATVLPLLMPEPASRGLILHVDDDDAMRRSTALLMRAAGYDTREAAYGEQALAQADSLRGRLDVLIVDYHLGHALTGTEVAGDPANAEVPWLADAPVWVARKPLLPETLLAALPPLVAFRRAVAAAATH